MDDAICEAVVETVLSEGAGATMEAIALAAGITRKGLYGRYPDRNLLMTTMVRRLLTQADGLEIDYAAPPETALHDYILTALQLISQRSSRATQRLMNARPPWLESILPEILATNERHLIQPLSDYLARCNIRGTLSMSDPQLAAKAILQLLQHQNIMADIPGEGSGWQEDYAKFLMGIVYHGMKPRQQT